MDATDIADELKSRIQRLYIVGAVVGLAIIVGVWIAWPKSPDVVKMIEEAKKELTKQHEAVVKEKNEKLKESDIKIKDLNARIVVSKGQYAVILKKYQALVEAQVNVQPARTDQEMRDRFTAAGFAPVPADQHRAGLICFDSR